MKINPQYFSIQPLIACGNYYPPCRPAINDQTVMTLAGRCDEYILQYRTYPQGLRDVLPEPWEPTENPIVTVIFMYNEDSDVVERGSYHLSTILIECTHKEYGTGNYCLMMPENNNYAIFMGRDASGVPKYFADLPKPYLKANSNIVCEARSWCYNEGAQWQPYYGIEFGPMEKCNEEDLKKWEKIVNDLVIFATKVIPGAGAEPSNGFELVSSIKYKYLTEFTECWIGGEANFFLNENLEQSLTVERRTVDMLKNKLPVLEVLHTIHWHGIAGDNPNYSFYLGKHDL